MFGLFKSATAAFAKSTFDADFKTLKGLSPEGQLRVYRTIGPVINNTLDKMETMASQELSEHLYFNTNVAKELRHIAIKNGARDKTHVEWLAAAVAESFYNCMRTSPDNMLHAVHQIMPWLMFIEALQDNEDLDSGA
jgi:hypothetical protein